MRRDLPGLFALLSASFGALALAGSLTPVVGAFTYPLCGVFCGVGLWLASFGCGTRVSAGQPVHLSLVALFANGMVAVGWLVVGVCGFAAVGAAFLYALSQVH